MFFTNFTAIIFKNRPNGVHSRISSVIFWPASRSKEILEQMLPLVEDPGLWQWCVCVRMRVCARVLGNPSVLMDWGVLKTSFDASSVYLPNDLISCGGSWAVVVVCVRRVWVLGDLATPLGSWIGTFEKVVSIPVHFTHPVMLLLMADPGWWWWWCVCVYVWEVLNNPSGLMGWNVWKRTFDSSPFYLPCSLTACGFYWLVVVWCVCTHVCVCVCGGGGAWRPTLAHGLKRLRK